MDVLQSQEGLGPGEDDGRTRTARTIRTVKTLALINAGRTTGVQSANKEDVRMKLPMDSITVNVVIRLIKQSRTTTAIPGN